MEEVIFEQENSTLVITLNREKVLNALNLNMVRKISKIFLPGMMMIVLAE